MDGFFNINKPEGITSFSTVARVKKIAGEKKLGHGGTLDPMATGVLPVLLGKATRMAEYLHLFPKTYKAQIELGVTTDTYDKDGMVISRSNASQIKRERVVELLMSFKGIIKQAVPAYSSAKLQGRPLYSLARGGLTVSTRRKEVKVYEIGLVSWQWPLFRIRVICGKGTYIRSLAHEIGQALGCGAILNSLERESYGPFHISDALFLDLLSDIIKANQQDKALYPLDFLFKGLSRVTLTWEDEKALNTGKSLELDALLYRDRLDIYLPAYNAEGQFLGVLRQEHSEWRWHKVFK